MTAPPLPRKNNVITSEPPPLPRKDSNAGLIGGVYIPPDALETPNPSINQAVPPPLPKKEIISSSLNSIVEPPRAEKVTDLNQKPTSNPLANSNENRVPRKSVIIPTKNANSSKRESRPLPVPKTSSSAAKPPTVNKSSNEQKLGSSIEDLWAQCSVDETSHSNSSSAFAIQEVKTVSHTQENQKNPEPQLQLKSSETESMWQSFMEIHKDAPTSEQPSQFSPFETPSETLSTNQVPQNPPQLPSRSSKPVSAPVLTMPPLPSRDRKPPTTEEVVQPPTLPPKDSTATSRRKSQDFNAVGAPLVRTRSSSDPDALNGRYSPNGVSSLKQASGTGWASGKREVASVNYGEKSAFLDVHEGLLGQWKKRWCVVEGGNLKIYMNQDDANPFKIWNLQEYELTLAPTLKKYSLHLGKLKKHHYLRCQTQTELDEWMNFLGKFTKEVSVENTEAAPVVINRPLKQSQVEKKVEPVQKIGSSCSASIVATELHEENKRDVFTVLFLSNSMLIGQSYTVNIMFKLPGKEKAQKWTIYRRFSQFHDLYTQMISGGIKLTEPFPEKTTSKNYHPEFVEKRKIELNSVLQELTTHCDTILASKKLTFHFCKFIFPVQHGDRKADDFVLPFPIELE